MLLFYTANLQRFDSLAIMSNWIFRADMDVLHFSTVHIVQPVQESVNCLHPRTSLLHRSRLF